MPVIVDQKENSEALYYDTPSVVHGDDHVILKSPKVVCLPVENGEIIRFGGFSFTCIYQSSNYVFAELERSC